MYLRARCETHNTTSQTSWYWMNRNALIFTVRKRSLGQGNVFTPVCHSVHRGVVYPSMQWSGCVYSSMQRAEDVYPSMQWGRPPWADTLPLARNPPGRPPPQKRRPLKRAVRVLQECILVLSQISVSKTMWLLSL